LFHLFNPFAIHLLKQALLSVPPELIAGPKENSLDGNVEDFDIGVPIPGMFLYMAPPGLGLAFCSLDHDYGDLQSLIFGISPIRFAPKDFQNDSLNRLRIKFGP
jgi:hypothetical protein